MAGDGLDVQPARQDPPQPDDELLPPHRREHELVGTAGAGRRLPPVAAFGHHDHHGRSDITLLDPVPQRGRAAPDGRREDDDGVDPNRRGGERRRSLATDTTGVESFGRQRLCHVEHTGLAWFLLEE
jgi:hypothetical protein